MKPETPSDPPSIPGQMTVEECIAEVERVRAQGPTDVPPPRPLTAAEVVALRLKEQ